MQTVDKLNDIVMIFLPLNVIKYHASFVLTLVMEIANVRDLQEGDYGEWVRLLDL